MTRLPIRLRLALVFALATAVVLAAAGLVLYVRLGSSLDEAIDEGLEARLADVAGRGAGGARTLSDGGRARLADPEEHFAQLLRPPGDVLDATPGAGGAPVLPAEELARLDTERVVRLDRGAPRSASGHERVLAVAIDTPQGRRIAVVGASLEDRDEALRGLLTELLVVGPVALVLTSLLGYGVAAAALRPVDAIRAEAAAISGMEPGRRLPVPGARDELARLARTLNAMLERLERALQRERTFVADASHELRTPLALLRAELELALRRPRSRAELAEALRSAAAEADRLARLAEDLLVLARSDEDRLALRREPLVARDVLVRVADRFASEAAASDREIEVEAPDRLRVAADAVRLEQALGNLVANALHHGRGRVRLAACERDGAVELHVADEGPGFPPEFVPRAFERFTRADEARSRGGAGLGLAIVDVIARAHGGSARAVNRAGRGADVYVTIPSESARAGLISS